MDRFLPKLVLVSVSSTRTQTRGTVLVLRGCLSNCSPYKVSRLPGSQNIFGPKMQPTQSDLASAHDAFKNSN